MTTEPTTFREKPVEIQAMRWDGTTESATTIVDWVLAGDGTAACRCSDPDRCAANDGDCPHWIAIRTLEGTMLAHVNDYVIRGVQGEFYPCKPDIFAATYDEVSPSTLLARASIAACHADASSRPVAAVPAPVQGADPTGPQTDADDDPAELRHELEQAYADSKELSQQALRLHRELDAERKRADKAEAERDKAVRLLSERDEALARQDIGDKALNLAEDAIGYVDPSDKAEFYARLAELRAGAKEAQAAGTNEYDRGFTDGAAHERGRHRLFGCPDETADDITPRDPAIKGS